MTEPTKRDESPHDYTKKPVTIRAIEWTGDNLRAVIDFTGLHKSAAKWTWEEYEQVVKKDGLKIFTLEGQMMASIGDYIIRGVKGEFYPCKPDIFAATYAASAQSAEPQGVEAQRHEIRFIDATPDEGYIRRILEAYIDDSYYSDNTAGLPPENKVYKMMNKWREERNALLRAALARLASKPSRSEEHELDAFRHAMVMAFQEIRRARRDEGMSEWADDDMANWVLANMPAALPSREEEMREQIERIKHDCENALRSSTHHKCDYLSLIQSINDRLARAALAQGGARDEAQGEGKR